MKSIFQWVVFCLVAASSVAFAQSVAETSGTVAETSSTLGAATQTNTLASEKADAAYSTASSLLAAKDFDAFTSAATKFLEEYPDAPVVQRAELEFGLASIPYIQSNWTQARTSLDQFAATHADAASLVEAKYRATMCSFHAGALNDFKLRAEAFLAQQPAATAEQKERLDYTLALVPYQQNKLAEAYTALKDFAAAHAGSPLGRDAEFYADLTLFSQNVHNDYRLKADAFLTEHPDAPKFQRDNLKFCLAMIPYRQQAWIESQEALEALVAEDGATSFTQQARCRAAYSRFYQGNYDEFKPRAEALLAEKRANLTEGDIEDLRYGLARVALMEGKWREAADKLAQFSSQYPNSQHRQIAEYTRAEALLSLARAVQDTDTSQSATLLSQGQAVMSEVRTNMQKAAVTESDPEKRFTLELMGLESWYVEKNIEQLTQGAERLAGQYAKPSRGWAMSTLWLGIARVNGKPQDLKGAAEAFDAVLAENKESSVKEDRVLTSATFWRTAGWPNCRGTRPRDERWRSSCATSCPRVRCARRPWPSLAG